MSKRAFFTAACAIAAAAVAGSAMAQSEATAAHSIFEQTAVPVSYADLDLASPYGAQTMLQRLQHAALNACGADDGSVKPYKWAVRHSACYHRSLDTAVASLDAPSVTRLYDSGAVPFANE